MKLSEKQKAELREQFREMSPSKKAEYIYDYYRWYIFGTVVILGILGNICFRIITHREPVLYEGLVNISIGEDLEKQLTDNFLTETGHNLRKESIEVYHGLYLSSDPADENHQYAYASRLKVMATIADETLDIVLMNKEGYDLLSHQGYLMDLSKEASLPSELLCSNTIILEDNDIAYELNVEKEHVVVSEEAVNALRMSTLPLFQKAEFDGDVYLGVLANTPRMDVVLKYIDYLLQHS